MSCFFLSTIKTCNFSPTGGPVAPLTVRGLPGKVVLRKLCCISSRSCAAFFHALDDQVTSGWCTSLHDHWPVNGAWHIGGFPQRLEILWYTLPETNIDPWKGIILEGVSFSNHQFSGDMSVSGRVNHSKRCLFTWKNLILKLVFWSNSCQFFVGHTLKFRDIPTWTHLSVNLPPRNKASIRP